jgi:hypothetical protein
MSDVTVRNLIGGVLVLSNAYKAVGKNGTVAIPLSVVQREDGVRLALSGAITNGSASATYGGGALSATDIDNIGTSNNYWQQPWYQAAIATATQVIELPLENCNITHLSACGVAAVLAVGESMTIDVQKIDPTTSVPVSVLLAPAVVDDTNGLVAAGPVNLDSSIDAAAAGVPAGWIVQVVLTYVPGGGATGVDFLTVVGFEAID